MPRPKSTKPSQIAKSGRQAEYRKRLVEAGRPESSLVDVAIAAATSRVFTFLAEQAKSGVTLTSSEAFRLIVKYAKADLVARGKSATEAKAKLLARLRYRHSVTL